MKITFKDLFKGKVVIVGMGNTMRADDGFGPALIERLKPKVKAVCFDAGTSPENYTGKIIKEKPDVILIIDAVDLGVEVGRYEILEKDNIIKTGFTTHDISCNLLMEYLERETEAKIYMLGVQPKDISFGGKMSNSLIRTLEELEKMIEEADNA